VARFVHQQAANIKRVFDRNLRVIQDLPCDAVVTRAADERQQSLVAGKLEIGLHNRVRDGQKVSDAL
jgi:hypothetical protein